MPTTYELLTDAAKLLAVIEDADGELTEESISSMDDFLMVADDKLGAIKAVISKMKAETVLHKQWRDHHVGRVRSLTKAIDYLTGNGTGLLKAMEDLGEEPKVKADWGSVSLRTTQSVVLAENWVDTIPTQFLVEQPPKPDKKGLKEFLKTNKLKGAELQTNRKAVWR
mgnify:CR=1 FL=1|tara:strand:+ start:1238 stop:1741 length:504 start_codon:yes stop_codon:yes gene_type:complete